MVYVFAPFGLIVKACPEQIIPLFTVIVGFGLTTKLLVTFDEHPVIVFVPTTVNVPPPGLANVIPVPLEDIFEEPNLIVLPERYNSYN